MPRAAQFDPHGWKTADQTTLLSTIAMRSLSFVGLLLLAVPSLAAIVPQLVLDHHGEQGATVQSSPLGANDASAKDRHEHQNAVIETNQTIYQYLSQQTR